MNIFKEFVFFLTHVHNPYFIIYSLTVGKHSTLVYLFLSFATENYSKVVGGKLNKCHQSWKQELWPLDHQGLKFYNFFAIYAPLVLSSSKTSSTVNDKQLFMAPLIIFSRKTVRRKTPTQQCLQLKKRKIAHVEWSGKIMI